MNIVVEVRTVYGKEMIYPVCASARHFAIIAGTKTLSRDILAQVKFLGFEVKQQFAPGVLADFFR